MKDIDELIREVVKLVSVPDVYYKLETLIEQPHSTVDDFAFVIGADADLCARLLNLANSAFYSMSVPIESIEKAVMQIGVRQIREMVLVTAIKGAFDALPSGQVDMDSFWRHSIAVGMMAKHLAKAIRMPQPDRMYVPGLLHDIGRLVLFLKLGADMGELMIRRDDEKLSLHRLEFDYLSYTHAEVGGRLLAQWKVPPSIVEPVLHHHQPHYSFEFHRETCLIFIADRVVMDQGFGDSGEANIGPFLESDILIVKELGLNIDQLAEIWVGAEEEIKDVSRQFLKH